MNFNYSNYENIFQNVKFIRKIDKSKLLKNVPHYHISSLRKPSVVS